MQPIFLTPVKKQTIWGGHSLAQEYGFQSCTLGPRILRCETAPLCALTAILYAAGALD